MGAALWISEDEMKDLVQRATKAEAGLWISFLTKEINELLATKSSDAPVLTLLPQVVEKSPAAQVWEAYRDAFKARYEVEPVRNAKLNSQIVQFVKRLGNEAVDVTKFYLSTNDQYYRINYHDFGLLLHKAETLRTAWLKGQTISRKQAQQDEQATDAMSQLKRIQEGKV